MKVRNLLLVCISFVLMATCTSFIEEEVVVNEEAELRSSTGPVISGPSTMHLNTTATFNAMNTEGFSILWTNSPNLERISPNPNVPPIGDIVQFRAIATGTGWIEIISTGTGQRGRHTVQVGEELPPPPLEVVISGTRWATRNVGMPGTFVAHPQDYGRLYQWGTLNGVTHHWDNTSTVSGWNGSDARVAWTAANDPCPAGWRLPTEQELRSLGSGIWTNNWNHTGIAGQTFGTPPNQIFLPAAGVRNPGGGIFGAVGAVGDYWGITHFPVSLRFSDTENWMNGVSYWHPAFAKSIRCVAE